MLLRLLSCILLTLPFACRAFELPLDIACCPAPPRGQAVVNADQTVILIWDPVSKMEHFIRQASFKSEAADFGFLIPTPNQPELEESANDVFKFLGKLTAPEVVTRHHWREPSIGCGESAPATAAQKSAVRVLDEKLVAGFHAVVLEASSAGALVKWLTEHGYVLSAEIEAWAKPYVDASWKITALKVARQPGEKRQDVDASALRLSFKTDRPLFPYREPDYKNASQLTQASRLLRIYFIGDARYKGDFSPQQPWPAKAVWSNKLDAAARKTALESLKIAEASTPAEWWLTEFEDNWPYTVAPGDVYFSADANQNTLKRPPYYIDTYTEFPFTCSALFALFVAAVVIVWRTRRKTA